jgi:site-specific DNA-cytosine methylase
MRYDACDVMGFAGGFTLGMVQAGFHLVGKKELPGGFGVRNCEANRHLLGDDWRAQIAPGEEWTYEPTHVVFGNPPCSGFSVMTAKEHRGIDAKINSCMWHFADYVAKTRPYVSVMESVRVAFTTGRSLMQALRADVETKTGLQYTIHHVFQDALELGGAARRPRYFFVLTRVPFGVEYPTVQQPTLRDVIADLDGLDLTWEQQPYRRPATWWSDPARSPAGTVDGHQCASSPIIRRALEVIEHGGTWPQGRAIATVLKDYYDAHGELPPSWKHQLPKLIEKQWFMGFTTMVRWREDRPARVITGAALQSVLHPWLDRTITHRETARIMGYPDDWTIRPLAMNSTGPTWGKGITVQCGRWVGDWVRRSLDGAPGSITGDLISDREYFITAPWNHKKDTIRLTRDARDVSGNREEVKA